MNAPISRRKLAGLALATPLISALGTRPSLAQTPMTTDVATHATLADMRDVFDAEYGNSYEQDGFVVYDFSAEGQASYWVRFDANGYAESLEIDFSALPKAGLK